MRFHYKYFLFISALLALSACSNKSSDEQVAAWYIETKEEILNQADETPDSTFEHIDLNTGMFEKWHYYKKRPVKYEVRDANKTLRYAALYAEDSSFSLVKEYCQHGNLSYEGIEYKNRPYGTATWYDCETGKVIRQGNRFKFEKTGVWKQYNTDGTVKSEIRYEGKFKTKKLPRLDS